ncbi:hydroxyethylthiazole kinase-like uncharacterized protein yjeF [Neomicrococcus aestuarii]|uniref:ADP-dependent (S)-NAD(P)H-hydrate dehydratase n=1 Tax=Neomicrococcus aestuarii TaxID=556325 RepID=A0A7W8X165_9MICC|nr:NAD(P)H-hydrate dehydratase [Neomicrococcus aestuarii]MBB5513588.1 hydroxyethylthiazole kinase-like uncharacterized protein yjeF [Neomicrococcus aestuarii]
MIPAFTGEQIRAAEAPLLERGEGDRLMAKAAYGLAQHTLRALRERNGRTYGTRVVALIGPGNNGGDALFALAKLAARGVAAHAIQLTQRIHEAGAAELKRAGGVVLEKDSPEAQRAIAAADVIIDAALGTGATGGMSLPEVPRDARVIACDVPSGLHAGTGRVAPETIRADLTVTFGALKSGLVVGRGPEYAGRVEVIDIGLGEHLGAPDLYVIESADVADVLPRLERNANKYSRGVLGLVAGSAQYPGAAILSARSAVNAGVGMLRTIADGLTAELLATEVPESVAHHGALPANLNGSGSRDNGLSRITAWALGPGIGEDKQQQANVESALKTGLPAVADASALPYVTPASGGSHVVLTPHLGELERMLTAAGLRVSREDIEADPVRWARWAAVSYNSVVLFKGPSTIVCSPEGFTWVNTNSTPALATAGSGDVLTGLIGALLSAWDTQRPVNDLAKLAAAAAFLHGQVGIDLERRSSFGATALAEHIGSPLV